MYIMALILSLMTTGCNSASTKSRISVTRISNNFDMTVLKGKTIYIRHPLYRKFNKSFEDLGYTVTNNRSDADMIINVSTFDVKSDFKDQKAPKMKRVTFDFLHVKGVSSSKVATAVMNVCEKEFQEKLDNIVVILVNHLSKNKDFKDETFNI
jgi:hypothetical protein